MQCCNVDLIKKSIGNDASGWQLCHYASGDWYVVIWLLMGLEIAQNLLLPQSNMLHVCNIVCSNHQMGYLQGKYDRFIH